VVGDVVFCIQGSWSVIGGTVTILSVRPGRFEDILVYVDNKNFVLWLPTFLAYVPKL
jgi:hypothetical protein